MADIVVLGKVERHAPADSTAMIGDRMRHAANDRATRTIRSLEEGTDVTGEAEAPETLAGDMLAVVVDAVRVDVVDVARQLFRHWKSVPDKFAAEATAAIDPQGDDGVGQGEDRRDDGESESPKMHRQGCESVRVRKLLIVFERTDGRVV